MRQETKNQINDFLSYLESADKITSSESKRLIKSMESPLEKTHNHLPQLLTRKEVADMLKVSPKTISRLSDADILKRHSVGKRAYRYIKSEIFDYIGIGKH